MPNNIHYVIMDLAHEWKVDVSELVHDPHSVFGALAEKGLVEDSEGGFAYVAQLLGAKVSY